MFLHSCVFFFFCLFGLHLLNVCHIFLYLGWAWNPIRPIRRAGILEGSYSSPVRGWATISVRRSRESGSAQHHRGGGCCLARLGKTCHLCYARFVCSCAPMRWAAFWRCSGASEEEVVGLLWEPGGRQCWLDTFSITGLDFTSWHSSGEHPRPGKTGRYSPHNVPWLCGVCKVRTRERSKKG